MLPPSYIWRGHETCFGRKYEQEGLRAPLQTVGLQGATCGGSSFRAFAWSSLWSKKTRGGTPGPHLRLRANSRAQPARNTRFLLQGTEPGGCLLRAVRRKSGQIQGLASLTVRELLEGRTSNVSALRGEGPHAD